MDELQEQYRAKADYYFTQERKEVAPFIPKECRKLLDVGCGGGEFGASLKRTQPVEVWGVELQPEAAAIAGERLDRVICAPFNSEVAIPDAAFDVITFLDSLEHFPDVYPPLELSKRKLAPGGVLICSIPNVRYIENVINFIFRKDWQYTKDGVLDSTHLRFFTKKSMLRTFSEAGFVVESIDGINPWDKFWTSRKWFLVRQLFRPWIEDMTYLQYIIVAKPRNAP